MMGPTSPEYTNHLLKAYYSMSRLLWQAVENGLYSAKEIAKIAVLTDSNTVMDKKKSVAGDVKGKTPGASTSTKNKTVKMESGASGYLPQTLEQWSQFEIGEEMTSAWYDCINSLCQIQNSLF